MTTGQGNDVGSAPMVELRGVTKRFGEVTAVESASFSVAPGDFLTILGPSGSGKSTLLRMIAGFDAPTSGEIFIHGRSVTEVPPHRRSIGMVFQRLALFPHMTAAQNVAYPLKMRRLDPKTIPDRVAEYLKLVRLEGLGDRRVQQLSGGQQQRVAIARALVFHPDLLLLDEPLAALDRKLREDMQLEFRRIQQELGVTTINVTHDQREALVMSDRVIVMDKGRIQQAADPLATYNAPANAFVAGFLGMTNLMPGTVEAVDRAEASVRVGAHLFRGRNQGVERQGQPAQCALRAERVRLAAPDTPGALPATVREEIFEGDRLIYVCVADGLAEPLRVIDHEPSAHGLRAPGDRVGLAWRPEDLLVFAA
jgi:putative spermidine/putrescine transport system ATP-binding protein